MLALAILAAALGYAVYLHFLTVDSGGLVSGV